jgi:magnesium transporter
MSHETEAAVEVPPDLREAWNFLDEEEQVASFRQLPPARADHFFRSLPVLAQLNLLRSLTPEERRLWMRIVAPDDVADILQEAEPEEQAELLSYLDDVTRTEVTALMAYAEDDAGGLMNPRFARVRPDMTVDEAISYLRRQARERLEAMYYAYVLDPEQRLLGVISFRDLFAAPGETRVNEIMNTNFIAVPEDMDQEAVARLLARHDLIALPVVDSQGRMKGIVTVDDIVDVVQEEATEDIQKLGGMEALEAPYLQTGFVEMMKKRAGWLSLLFVGETITASAMARYEEAIARAVVLAVFVPLIISSGGNSGSQASTLVIRAMALGQVRLRDWWLVFRRELASGLGLGSILAGLGFARVVLWQHLFGAYGEHYLLVAAVVAVALLGVVVWGTLSGSTLPFALRALGFDPASASAPFVATLVDVTGVLIYFSVAELLLAGVLL